MSGSIIAQQVEGYKQEDPSVLGALDEMKQITLEMKAMLTRGRLDDFGDLLDAAWRSKQRLASGISTPDIDELYQQQTIELDRGKREAVLHKMQQLIYERTVFAPIWQLAFINGIGPRVGESGFGLIARFPYTAPYEDITIKGA